jgi:hypothetical protein
LLSCLACGQAADDPIDDIRAIVVNSLGEDLSLLPADESKAVTKSAVTVGVSPNQVLVYGLEAFAVSSRSNSIQVVDMHDWTVVREYSVGDGCNPYFADFTEDNKLIITCNQSNEMIRIDPFASMADNLEPERMELPTGADLLPFDSQNEGYARPQGVVVVGHYAYLTLSNLDQNWQPAGPGLVLKVDLAAWTKDKIISLSKTNPYTILRSSYNPEHLLISCAGEYPYLGTGVIDVLDISSNSIEKSISIGGAPGKIWTDKEGIAWIGDQMDGRLLRFDTKSDEILDSIMLCPADEDNQVYDFVSDVASDGQGRVFASCFATDQVHTFLKSQPESKDIIDVGDGPIALWVVQK